MQVIPGSRSLAADTSGHEHTDCPSVWERELQSVSVGVVATVKERCECRSLLYHVHQRRTVQPCLTASKKTRGRRAQSSGVSGQGHRRCLVRATCTNEWSFFSRTSKLANSNWLTRHSSQCNLELDFELIGVRVYIIVRLYENSSFAPAFNSAYVFKLAALLILLFAFSHSFAFTLHPANWPRNVSWFFKLHGSKEDSFILNKK